jgi:hypothetical protein
MRSIRRLFSRLVVVVGVGRSVVTASQFPDCVNGPLSNNTVCNDKASPAERAAALVKAMNITEKLVNLVEYDLPLATACVWSINMGTA